MWYVEVSNCFLLIYCYCGDSSECTNSSVLVSREEGKNRRKQGKGWRGNEMRKGKIKTWENVRDGRKDTAKQLFLTGWFTSFWKIIK